MGWNYRVMANPPLQPEGEIYLEIQEVYYAEDNDNNPNGYRPAHIGGDNLKEIGWTLDRMKECLKKPILWCGDRFPEEYKPEII